MNLRARRRADPTARLTSQLNRERGADRQLRRPIPTSTRPDAYAPRLAGLAPAIERDAQAGSGRLVSRWTRNEAGRLVMVWSLELVVDAAPAIRLSARAPERDAVALRRH
jgi:hypothetical protein